MGRVQRHKLMQQLSKNRIRNRHKLKKINNQKMIYLQGMKLKKYSFIQILKRNIQSFMQKLII